MKIKNNKTLFLFWNEFPTFIKNCVNKDDRVYYEK
jgi:hypothetical protein